MKRLLLALLCCAPISFAQAITTGPLSALPVNKPLMLVALAVLLVVVTFIVFKRKSMPLAVTPLIVLATAAVLWQVPALKAQVMLAFTNPAGETLPITVDFDGDSQSFAAADFTNSSGDALTIRQILLPTFEECFPDGLEPLTTPPAEVFTPCSEGQVLRNNASCRVDVHSVCADLALAAATTLSPLTQNLALSVNSPAADPALAGNARLIRMENTGSAPANNVQVN
ncbi:MAG TPA: midcut-by-XrtH protein, partial [Cellvibrionaceae bacterium]